MDDIYNNFEEYNRKVIMAFDGIITDMLSDLSEVEN